MSKFPERLNKLREEKGLTKNQLAKEVGFGHRIQFACLFELSVRYQNR